MVTVGLGVEDDGGVGTRSVTSGMSKPFSHLARREIDFGMTPSSEPELVKLSCDDSGPLMPIRDAFGLGRGDVSVLPAGESVGVRRGEGRGNSCSSSSSSIGEDLAKATGEGDTGEGSAGGMSSRDLRRLSTSSTVMDRAVWKREVTTPVSDRLLDVTAVNPRVDDEVGDIEKSSELALELRRL